MLLIVGCAMSFSSYGEIVGCNFARMLLLLLIRAAMCPRINRSQRFHQLSTAYFITGRKLTMNLKKDFKTSLDRNRKTKQVDIFGAGIDKFEQE